MQKVESKIVDILRSLDVMDCDIPQTIEAEKFVVCDIDGKRISKKTVRARIGERKYWSCMERAAFHWTAGTEFEGHEYGFDCRAYFKSI